MESFSFEAFSEIIDQDKYFIHRSNGEECFPILKEYFIGMKRNDVLKIIVPNGIIVDYSFADETIGQLLQEVWNKSIKDRYIVVQYAQKDQFENISASIEIRNLLALVYDGSNHPKIVGNRNRGKHLNIEALNETMYLLFNKKSLTASQMAQEYGIDSSAASMRLKRLHEAYLAQRDRSTEDSRLFVYRSLL